MIAWIVSLSAAFAVAMNGTMVTPMIVYAISRLPGYDEGSATIVASFEIAGIAIYSLLLPHLARRHGRIVTLAGFLLVIAGEASSAFTVDMVALSVARLATGFGEGAIFGLVASRLAARANAERLWGIVNLVGGTTMGFLLLGLSLLPASMTDGDVFLCLAAFAALMLPLALLTARDAAGPAAAIAPIVLPRMTMGLMLSVVFLVYFVQAGQWAIAVFVAEAGRIGTGEAGLSLAIASIVGFIGAIIPALTGAGPARLPSLVAGFGLMAVALYVFLNLFGPMPFLIGQIAINAGFYIVTPYVTGLLTEGDSDGALLSRVLVVALVGASVGTGIAGPIVAGLGAPVFGWIYMVPLALGALAAIAVFGRLARSGPAPGSTSLSG